MTRTLSEFDRIVVKVGSSLLFNEQTGELQTHWMATLAADIAELRSVGKEVVIVTSGSVAIGRDVLGLEKGSLSLEDKQAAAACGQIGLYSTWQEVFTPYGANVAQVLLTVDESLSRRRYLNARNTIETLLSYKAIPAINENDTVATSELKFGNNDRLAARVAQMSGADCFVMLTDVDGMYTSNPRTDPDAKHLAEIFEITPEIEAMAGGAGSASGTGGMITKLDAAKIAMAAGCNMVLASGKVPHPLMNLHDGSKSTWFITNLTPLSARKQWIMGVENIGVAVVVDAGAQKALKSGNSLLPIGITMVKGEFERGDTVLIEAQDGRIIGRGVSAYNATDARRILGKHSDEAEKILGFSGRTALIHRDDMVLE